MGGLSVPSRVRPPSRKMPCVTPSRVVELHVPLEHRVVQRLAIAPSHEVRAERLEDVLQRKRARPFAHGVRERDLAGERVAHEHVVGVRPMIDEVDRDGVGWKRFVRLVIDRDLVEEVEQPTGGAMPGAMIRGAAEEGTISST